MFDFLARLVRTPSPSTKEGEVARLVREELAALGITDVHTDDLGNVIVRLGSDDGPTLLYDAHMDTVLPAKTGWERDPLGAVVEEVRPVGGRRKVEALSNFANRYGQPLAELVVVGDSITDAKMLEAVDKADGLAIAFNANQYALPYATVGLASTHLSDLDSVLAAWEESGRAAAEKEVREREKAGGTANRGYYHWLAGRQDLDELLAIHRRIRRIVREEAGKLG